MDRRDLDHRFAAVGSPLVVAAEPAAPHQPGEGPLDAPSLRQQHEALRSFGPPHDFDPPLRLIRHCGPATSIQRCKAWSRYLERRGRDTWSRPTRRRAAGADPRRAGRAPASSAAASSAEAAVTTTASGRPSVSTPICRLRPVIFLPPSNPGSPPAPAVFTDRPSRPPAPGGRLAAGGDADPLPQRVEDRPEGALAPPTGRSTRGRCSWGAGRGAAAPTGSRCGPDRAAC